jgi:hypothetical protein
MPKLTKREEGQGAYEHRLSREDNPYKRSPARSEWELGWLVAYLPDRGSQCASGDFQKQLVTFGMKSSMSRKGDCWDKAVTETLFGSLKVERLHGTHFVTRRQADRRHGRPVRSWRS